LLFEALNEPHRCLENREEALVSKIDRDSSCLKETLAFVNISHLNDDLFQSQHSYETIVH